MKALCPLCQGKGCDKCKNGYVEVEIADGFTYTYKCEKCGFENGFFISDDPGLGGKVPDDEYIQECVECEGKVLYQLIGYSDGKEETETS